MSQSPITSFFKRKNDDEHSQSKRCKLTTTTDLVTSCKNQTLSKNLSKDIPKEKTLFIPANMDMKAIIRNTIARGASALNENIGVYWFRALQSEFNKPYFFELSKFVSSQRQVNTVYPPEDLVYSWTHNHDIRKTRVVILGQDPYHGPNQAHGMCFSVQKGIQPPPSLVNIFKELESDIDGFKKPQHGDLTGWAKQGVLLLNTCLTVNKSCPNSHANRGWETFTDKVITWISTNVTTSVVFILWGNPAQKKKNLIASRHKILASAHPSPLSAHRGFFGCKHFSQTNSHLKSQKLTQIDWTSL